MLKPELQIKFLQHLNQKKKGDEGFTLIELLVVVIIIGVLAAIALPSLLGQVNKAKQAEAKQNVGAINRAQQAYFLEQQTFATDLIPVGIGVKRTTNNYSYQVATTTDGNSSAVWAGAVKPALKSYIGISSTSLGDPGTSEVLTVAVACESLDPLQNPTVGTPGSNTCPANYTSLAK